MHQTLNELISATSELRALPSTTMRLMDLLDDATVSADQVLDVIEKDPSLTANLLKLSNSAYYGMRRQVGTVREALVMLGNQTIVNLAFATSMGDVLRGPLAGYRLERNELWHHALGSAMGAARLVAHRGQPSLRERAFTAGLVHDIGKLLLNTALKQSLTQLPPDASYRRLMRAEFEILGFDHAQAGAALGKAWNFPTSLIRIISAHHEPELAEGSWLKDDPDLHHLTCAVAGADIMAGFCGFGAGIVSLEEPLVQETMARLGFTDEMVEDVRSNLSGDLDAMLSVIGESR